MPQLAQKPRKRWIAGSVKIFAANICESSQIKNLIWNKTRKLKDSLDSADIAAVLNAVSYLLLGNHGTTPQLHGNIKFLIN